MDPIGRTETEAGLMQPDPSDKRPKLERAQSASEKENLPLQRSGSGLRRQYSQQEQPTTSRRLSNSEMGSGIPGGGGGGDPMISGPMGQRRHPSGHPYGNQSHYHHHNQSSVHAAPHQVSGGQSHQQYGFQQYQSQQQGIASHRTNSSNYPDDDPSFYQVHGTFKSERTWEITFCIHHFAQGELDGLMRQHPHLVHPRQQQQIYGGQQHQEPQQQQRMGQYNQMNCPSIAGKTHKRIGGYISQQRSFSSSEEDLRSTPDFDGEWRLKYFEHFDVVNQRRSQAKNVK